MTLTLDTDAGPFWRGDAPEDAYESGVLSDGAPVDLQSSDQLTAGLRAPDGTYAIATGARPIDADTDTFTLPWGASSPFTMSGVHWIDVQLNGVRVDPLPVVVEDSADGWATLAEARDEWRDLPSNPRVAYTLLQIARHDVIEYAPTLAPDARVPANYVKAQIMHARDIWNSGHADPSSGDLGEGSFALTPYPLDWMIRQLLRPARAIPRVPRYPQNGAQ